MVQAGVWHVLNHLSLLHLGRIRCLGMHKEKLLFYKITTKYSL